MLLEITDLNKHFGGLHAVRNATFSVEENKVTGLVGPNGAGKTTVFNMITGTIQVDSGAVTFRGADITRVTAQERVRHGIARTFQDVRLLPRLSVAENVAVGVQNQPGEGFFQVLFAPVHVHRREKETMEHVHACLDFVGINPKVRNEPASNLSYGEQKLVSIARLLATDSRLLLLDEPTSGLDEASLDQFRALLAKLISDGRTVLMVEHNMLLVRELCDQAVFMATGDVLAVDTPEKLMEMEELREVYFGA
nr:ABC transporter ATP-binding protein [Glaciibacter superstes]